MHALQGASVSYWSFGTTSFLHPTTSTAKFKLGLFPVVARLQRNNTGARLRPAVFSDCGNFLHWRCRLHVGLRLLVPRPRVWRWLHEPWCKNARMFGFTRMVPRFGTCPHPFGYMSVGSHVDGKSQPHASRLVLRRRSWIGGDRSSSGRFPVLRRKDRTESERARTAQEQRHTKRRVPQLWIQRCGSHGRCEPTFHAKRQQKDAMRCVRNKDT